MGGSGEASPMSPAWERRGALEPKLVSVSERPGYGRELMDVMGGFVAAVRVVLIVFVREGVFAEYGGGEVLEPKVSDRAMVKLEASSS